MASADSAAAAKNSYLHFLSTYLVSNHASSAPSMFSNDLRNAAIRLAELHSNEAIREVVNRNFVLYKRLSRKLKAAIRYALPEEQKYKPDNSSSAEWMTCCLKSDLPSLIIFKLALYCLCSRYQPRYRTLAAG